MVVRCLPTPHHTHSFFLYILKRFCNHPSHGIMQSIVLENPRQVCLQKPYCFGHKCSQSAVKQIVRECEFFILVEWLGIGSCTHHNFLGPLFLDLPLASAVAQTNKNEKGRRKHLCLYRIKTECRLEIDASPVQPLIYLKLS